MSRPADGETASDAPILITMGEPGGVGPEVALAAFAALNGRAGSHPLTLVGNADVFRRYGAVADDALVALPFAVSLEIGKADPANAGAVTGAIEHAVTECLGGRAAAIVTAPINKAALTAAGFRFPGHTEYLVNLTGAARGVMMLAGSDLRVVPLTIHSPLRTAVDEISSDAIVETGRIILSSLKRDFGVAAPRLAVAGLNPHAGESGTIGTEESEIIAPAIAALRGEGHTVLGPLPADTMFHAEARTRYDAALCMYHDQALIPIKTLHFWDGVNVTLGLPIVRTSPDHGTALDIAGTGKADARSMIAAIRLAAQMADARNR